MAVIKKIKDDPSDTSPEVTTNTLSNVASHTSLGTLNDREAFIVALCQLEKDKAHAETIASLNNTYSEKYSSLNGQIIEFKEKYKGLLRELRDSLQNIKFDDLIKIFIGLLGGLIASIIKEKGFYKALCADNFLVYIIIFGLCFLFLIFRYCVPLTRKNEIKSELDKLNGANNND